MIDYYFNKFSKIIYICICTRMHMYIYVVNMTIFFLHFKVNIFNYFQINNYDIIKNFKISRVIIFLH